MGPRARTARAAIAELPRVVPAQSPRGRAVSETVTETVSARDAILAAVRAARPPSVEPPEALSRVSHIVDAAARSDAFIAAATAAGAAVTLCAPADVPRIVAGAIGNASAVLSYVDGVSSTVPADADLHGLDTLDVLVCDTSLGVAENGAVWIASGDPVLRAALFLAARVVIVIAEEHLVDDLHQAYDRIDVRAHPFGAFVAGPSKTADIEQALVIGAHGPKELTLVLVRAGDARSPEDPGSR
jgi:L-lactate dehydrogenase complex protein LldG